MTILLVSGATATLRRMPPDAPVGHLVTPFTGNSLETIATTGRPWAADNGCGPREDGSPGVFDQAAFETMLAGIQEVTKDSWQEQQANRALGIRARWPLWVASPDMVGDWRTTWERWQEWYPILSGMGLRIAYVAQDGQPLNRFPIGAMHCLFIGGSDEYKESEEARRLVEIAKFHGKRVHVGRVNTDRRERLFDDVGVAPDGYPAEIDSVDGTQYSRFPDRYIPRWCDRQKPSMRLSRPVKTTPMDTFWKGDFNQ